MLALALPSLDKLYTAFGAVVLAVLVLLLDMVRNAVSEWREKKKKMRQSSSVYLAEKQVRLDVGTERTCLEMKADHVAIYRLHNGEFFEGNDSIKKMSMASEAPAWARWKNESQALLMSSYPHLVLAVEGPQKAPFYVVTPDNALDFELGRLLNQRGYASCVVVLVCGKKNKPLALLVLSWHTLRISEADLNASALEGYRRDFSFILSE